MEREQKEGEVQEALKTVMESSLQKRGAMGHKERARGGTGELDRDRTQKRGKKRCRVMDRGP